MTIRFLPAALAAVLLLTPGVAAAQTPAPSPAAAAPAAPAAAASPLVADPKIEALAKSLLHALQTNTLDRSMMTDQMNAQMTADVAKNAAAQMAALGDYTSFTYAGEEDQDGLKVYQFLVAFKTITLKEYVGITPDGKIAGLQFGK
jgi:hypothetical protein